MSDGWAEPWIFPLPWPPLADPVTQIGLRPWGAGEDDAPALAAAWADPEIARWTSVPDAHDVDAARTWIRGEEVRRSRGLAMDLVISHLDEPRQVLGEVGLVMVEADKGWAELGFWLASDARGRGRAAAAASVFVEWVLRELPVQRLFARTQPDNPKAGRVAEAAGMARAGELETGTEVWIRDRSR
jgi:RimJ/RimL family protein N-acetyltransferase